MKLVRAVVIAISGIWAARQAVTLFWPVSPSALVLVVVASFAVGMAFGVAGEQWARGELRWPRNW